MSKLVMIAGLSLCINLYGIKEEEEVQGFLWPHSLCYSEIKTLESIPNHEQEYLKNLNVDKREPLIQVYVYNNTSYKWFNNPEFSTYFPFRLIEKKQEGETIKIPHIKGGEILLRCQRRGIPEGFDKVSPFQEAMAQYRKVIREKYPHYYANKPQFNLKRIFATTIVVGLLVWQCKNLYNFNFFGLFKKITRV